MLSPDSGRNQPVAPLHHFKILFDKPGAPISPFPMASPEKKSFSPIMLVIDLALTAGFFVFIFGLVKPHVPSLDSTMINLWGALAAGCMSGVFWLAMQMLKTVYRFQRDSKK